MQPANRLVKARQQVGMVYQTLGLYQYDGLGRRIVKNPTGIVGDDEHEFYTHAWQRIEVRPDGETSTTGASIFVYGIRYIDDIILRDRDANETGPLEERRYYLTDANYNVVMILSDDAYGSERIFYQAYGEPECFSFGDVNGDYAVDANDVTAINALIPSSNSAATNILADLNLDGTISAADRNLLQTYYGGRTGGANVLSVDDEANDIGYAGYIWNDRTQNYHVRNREYSPQLGRWLQRDSGIQRRPTSHDLLGSTSQLRIHGPDPRTGVTRKQSAIAGYLESLNLYEYASSSSVSRVDPSGRVSWACIGCGICMTAVVASCTALCGTDPMWDDRNDGFSGCMFKCLLTSLGFGLDILDEFIDYGLTGNPITITPADIAASACGAVCVPCGGKYVKRFLMKYYKKWHNPKKHLAPLEIMSGLDPLPLRCPDCIPIHEASPPPVFYVCATRAGQQIAR